MDVRKNRIGLIDIINDTKTMALTYFAVGAADVFSSIYGISQRNCREVNPTTLPFLDELGVSGLLVHGAVALGLLSLVSYSVNKFFKRFSDLKLGNLFCYGIGSIAELYFVANNLVQGSSRVLY